MNPSTMDWNGSANGAMQSPKKKLHLKVKDNNNDDEMKNAVTNVRRNLKSGKDISARNLETLMEHPRKPAQEEISYSSDYEEVVVIEEEPTDGYEPYVDSENGEEEIEEIEYEEEEEVIDEDGEELEALPPPIKIPKALQHKDSDSEDDHEDDSSYTTASSDEEDEEDDPDVERKFSSWRNEAEEAEKQAKKAQKEEEEAEEKKRAKKMLEEDDDEEEEDTFDAEPVTCPDDGKRPDKIRGYSYNPELPNPNKPMKKWTRPTPKTNETVENKATAAAPPSPKPAKKWTRPAAPRVVNAPKRAPSLNQLDANGRPDLAWTKPDWVSNGAKLRPTGKSAAANLAKPITNLPHMNKNYDDNNTTITTSNNNTNNHDNDVKPPPKQPGHATVLSKAPKSPSVEPTPKAAGTAQITKKMPVYPKSPAKAKKSAAVPPPAAVMKTPTKSPNTDITRKASLPKSPKSAPTAPRPSCPEPPAAELLDEDDNKVIEWEKPDWAQRRVLRSTSKTEALYAGKKIERPIGGIRPLEEEK